MPGHQTPVQDIMAQHFQASSIHLVWSVLEIFLWVIIVSDHRTAKTFLWVPLWSVSECSLSELGVLYSAYAAGKLKGIGCSLRLLG